MSMTDAKPQSIPRQSAEHLKRSVLFVGRFRVKVSLGQLQLAAESNHNSAEPINIGGIPKNHMNAVAALLLCVRVPLRGIYNNPHAQAVWEGAQELLVLGAVSV